MFIAQRLQEHNRAEYLLYMWQVEDIIRANDCDLDKLRTNYLCKFQLTDTQRGEMEQWYEHLCNMLREEGKTKSGHLRINRNVVEGLAEIHAQLIGSSKFPYYNEMYRKVLPYVVELRAKNNNTSSASIADELELCFEFLYGVMLLRLQKKEISSATSMAAQDVSTLLGQLSDYWKAERSGALTTD